MKKRVKIEVTEECIAEGRVTACERCPIALAVNKVLKPENVASVCYDLAVFNNTHTRTLVETPLPEIAPKLRHVF